MSEEFLWFWAESNKEKDCLDCLSNWKKGYNLLKALEEEYWNDKVLELRREMKTPWEIQKILESQNK